VGDANLDGRPDIRASAQSDTVAVVILGGGASSTTFDVIVVGAGMAGLGAAAQLRANGVGVVVLEASSRIGGRTISDNATFAPQPVDVGGQFFHQASANALVPIAQQRGFALVTSLPPPLLFAQAGIPADLASSLDFLNAVNQLSSTIDLQGQLIKTGAQPDVSGAVATAGLAGLPFYNLAARLQSVSEATEMSRFSTLDLYNSHTWGRATSSSRPAWATSSCPLSRLAWTSVSRRRSPPSSTAVRSSRSSRLGAHSRHAR
jgi:phytoene dehydrogenase-like protein